MRAILTAAILTIATSLTAQENVNKYLFTSGMEFNTWNYDIIRKGYNYFNYMSDSNEELYNQALMVIEKYGFEFDKPTVENIVETEENDIHDLIYERYSLTSDVYIENEYINDNVKIVVKMSGHHSAIYLYPIKVD